MNRFVTSVLIFFLFILVPAYGQNVRGGFPAIIVNDALIKKFDTLVQAWTDVELFNGTVLVAHEGKVIFEKGYGNADFAWDIPNGIDTVYDLASISKSFTAMGILMLMERGVLDLDKSVSTYLPELEVPVYNQMTIRQLLTHKAGLPDEPIIPALRRGDDFHSRRELLKALNQLELFSKPGERFSYSNSGYNILALIIEKVARMPYGQFLKLNIFTPAGMTGAAFRDRGEVLPHLARGYGRIGDDLFQEQNVDADIRLMGVSEIHASVRDLFNWDQAIYQHTLISKETTELMFKNQGQGYALGWEVPSNYILNSIPQRVMGHRGRGPGACTSLQRFPDDQLLIVVLSNVQNAKSQTVADLLSVILANGSITLPRPQYEKELLTILFEQGIPAARDAYLQAKKEKISDVPSGSTLNIMANQFLRRHRIPQALAVFGLYRALAPASYIPYDGYAETLLADGQREAALAEYQKSLELNFDSISARRSLSYLGVSVADPITSPVFLRVFKDGIDAGMKTWSELKEKGGDLSEAYINAVAYNLKNGNRITNGMQLFELNTRIFPDSWNAWDSLAEIEVQLGQKTKALKHYRESLRLNPSNEGATRNIEALSR